MKIIIPLILLVCISTTTNAKHLHPERYYQEKWCAEQGGQTEVVLDDKTRVDCLTDTCAIEVDFATKWAGGDRPGTLLRRKNRTAAGRAADHGEKNRRAVSEEVGCCSR